MAMAKKATATKGAAAKLPPWLKEKAIPKKAKGGSMKKGGC
jgi:hypothetical protein